MEDSNFRGSGHDSRNVPVDKLPLFVAKVSLAFSHWPPAAP